MDLKKGRGLSPLARGTRRDYSKEDAGDRFIPAGAGNTGSVCGSIAGGAVYPRWRGEHPPLAPSNSGTVGLSPLARGTHVANRLIIIYFRFIPAGAGNTIEIVFGIYSEAVYPRWRGEHRAVALSCCAINGLSPLARGTRRCDWCGKHTDRFIPAGAGNTLNITYY